MNYPAEYVTGGCGYSGGTSLFYADFGRPLWSQRLSSSKAVWIFPSFSSGICGEREKDIPGTGGQKDDIYAGTKVKPKKTGTHL